MDAAAGRGTAGVHARKDPFEPAEPGLSEPGARNDSLYAEREAIAAAPARDIDDAAQQVAVSDRHRIAQRVDAADRLERQVQRRVAGRRVGHVEAIEEHRRLVRTRAAK